MSFISVIWMTVLLLVLWRTTRPCLWYFHNETVVGVISAMVEKELGETNFGFDFLKLAVIIYII